MCDYRSRLAYVAVVTVRKIGVFLCFFFFKQKTAYEMRISDWSSDVCSSDLHIKTNPMVHFPDAAGLAAATGDLRQTGYSRLHGGAQDVVRDQVHEGPIELLHVRPGADHGHIAEQDINELRDLVQIGPAQQGADSRDTRVVLVGLAERSEESRVGKECVSKCRTRWAA